MKNKERNLTVVVDEDFFFKIKLEALKKKKTLKEFVIEIIKEKVK